MHYISEYKVDKQSILQIISCLEGCSMELELVKMMMYAFIGIIGAFVVYVTALYLILNHKINHLKKEYMEQHKAS